MDPTPAVADNGVVYSSCFRRRTNHQSIANIAKATNFMLAHSPTYLLTQTGFGLDLWSVQKCIHDKNVCHGHHFKNGLISMVNAVLTCIEMFQCHR